MLRLLIKQCLCLQRVLNVISHRIRQADNQKEQEEKVIRERRTRQKFIKLYSVKRYSGSGNKEIGAYFGISRYDTVMKGLRDCKTGSGERSLKRVSRRLSSISSFDTEHF